MPTDQPIIVLSSRVHASVIDFLTPHGRLILNQTSEALSTAELLAQAHDAAALMAFMCDEINAVFLAACPRLRVVAGALKGFDNIDVAAATRQRIYVTNVPGFLTAPTAELAVTLLLGLARKLAAADHHMRTQPFAGWRPTFYGTGLSGRLIGILGMGVIGQAIARRLAGFEVRLQYYDVRPLEPSQEQQLQVQRVGLEEMLSTSDCLLAALPLTDTTRHLLNREALSRLKPNALLVNVGRGSVVDETAVADALLNDRLGGYAADVFAMEDRSLPDRPPSIPPALLADRDRTLFTPHLGSAIASVRQAIEHEAAENIVDVFQGKRPRGAVNSW
jgi:phosphonate dehydrogenase